MSDSSIPNDGAIMPKNIERPHLLGSQANSDAITDLREITFTDLRNPYILHRLCDKSNQAIMIKWLQDHHLIRDNYWCNKCDSPCVVTSRTSRREGISFRCKTNSSCEYTFRKDSFFEQFRLSICDILMFLINYCDCLSLAKSGQRSGHAFSNTATRWAQIIRKIMMHRVHNEYFTGDIKFNQKCQLDECCLSRRVKYNKGVARGPVAWVFGCCCVVTGRILILPVLNRSAATLVLIIERYIEKGTKILTDGWGGYSTLNEIGYEAYAVNHSRNFQIQYYNEELQKIEIVDTNKMEGFWSHMRSYFRRRNGMYM